MPSLGDPNHNDPITVTPPSQRNCPDNRVSPGLATRRHEQTLPEGHVLAQAFLLKESLGEGRYTALPEQCFLG